MKLLNLELLVDCFDKGEKVRSERDGFETRRDGNFHGYESCNSFGNQRGAHVRSRGRSIKKSMTSVIKRDPSESGCTISFPGSIGEARKIHMTRVKVWGIIVVSRRMGNGGLSRMSFLCPHNSNLQNFFFCNPLLVEYDLVA